MLLGLGFDGGDSPQGGCTTHLTLLALHVLEQDGIDPVDYPWLIRLNPSIPFKTRGNGATALWLQVDTRHEAERIVSLLSRLVADYAEASGAGRKAALVALLYNDDEFPPSDPALTRLYWMSLRSYVPARVAREYLTASTATLLYAAGESITGASAALGARLDYDHTFELLVYMPPRFWGSRPTLEPTIIAEIDYALGPHSIATFDYSTGRPLIQPHGPDPVYAGIRSEEDKPLLSALKIIASSLDSEGFEALVYRTNQHTGVHITSRLVGELRVYTCARVEGRITRVEKLPGGHFLAMLCDHTGCIDAVAYRETGIPKKLERMNELVGSLATIEGCVKPHRDKATLNTERVFLDTRETRLSFEPLPSAWHHLYEPLSRAARVSRPRGLRRPLTRLYKPYLL